MAYMAFVREAWDQSMGFFFHPSMAIEQQKGRRFFSKNRSFGAQIRRLDAIV